MKLIGLDLGTNSGWAVREKGRPALGGTNNFSPSRFEGGGMRFLRFRRWLEAELLVGEVLAVAFEEVRGRHASQDSAHIYGGFLAEVSALCEAREIPYTGFVPGTIKKLATGKGNANKDAMIAAAKVRWPTLDIIDDNMADALWVSECGLVELKYDPADW